jgi:N utilization substance protein B
VTINEYIELAKQYSTPNSRQFINGILDVISKSLKESGKIKKSGRGLMDNK